MPSARLVWFSTAISRTSAQGSAGTSPTHSSRTVYSARLAYLTASSAPYVSSDDPIRLSTDSRPQELSEQRMHSCSWYDNGRTRAPSKRPDIHDKYTAL